MKKQFLLLIFMIAHIGIFAQSVCNVYIEPSFDSECILTDIAQEPQLLMSESNCNFVCKNSTVTYTAKGTSGNYTWTISGADSYSAQGNTITVHWGNSTSGMVMVKVETNGSVCYAELCVVLLDTPRADATSVPAYNNVGGWKVIEICLGETISFTDNSTATGTSPVTGYYWGSPYGVSGTADYEITPSQTGTFQVEHRIINSCGCEDVEYYKVTVIDTDIKFELSCYGTVCAGSTHTYTLIEPHCGRYIWSVEGGDIFKGQGTPQITIQWHNTSLGYGVISLDLSGCEATRCPVNSIRIPIISDNAEITGPELVCVGENVVYEVPLWGSTEYKWSITPQNGVVRQNTYKNANSQIVSFDKTGTYEISVEYYNEFLDCGEFYSLTKTVYVKEKLEIDPERSKICEGAEETFETNMNSSSVWRIYNSSNQLVFTTTGVSFTRTFNIAGTYRITANNVNACNTATSIITVAVPPPPLDISAISGPNTACPGTSITLTATPTSPLYTVVWEPICLDYKRSGEKVTIDYDSEVCNINVYQLDKTTGCLSEPIVYTVKEFVLAPFNISSPINICSGQTLTLSVANQSEVLYHWTILPIPAASVEGNARNHKVDIIVNHYNSPTITVQLKREYCGTETYDYVTLIADPIAVSPTIIAPDTICKNTSATFTAVDGNGVNIVGYCEWNFNGNPIFGNPVSQPFILSGTNSYTLTYQPPNACDPVIVEGTIFVSSVNATITAHIINSTLYFQVAQQENARYVWKKDGSVLQGQDGNIIPISVYGTYCCTVTDTVTNCTDTDCEPYYSYTPSYCTFVSIPLKVNKDCNKYTITATTPPPPPASLIWGISPNYQKNTMSYDLSSVTVNFEVPGIYRIFADAHHNGICYGNHETVTIGYVPKVDISFDCQNTIRVHDNSLYMTGYPVPTRTIVLKEGSTTIGTQVLNSGQYTATFNTLPPNVSVPTTYTAYMTMDDCRVTTSFTRYPLPVISVSARTPYCENTPLQLTVTGTNIDRIEWEFGDSAKLFKGDNVFHTYEGPARIYTLKVTAYNKNGCKTVYTKAMDIRPHNIPGDISYDNMVCMNEQQTIYWKNDPLYLSHTYKWSTPPANSGFEHFVYESADYDVTVTSDIGCVCQKMKNIPFYHKPTAKISGATTYCFGEPIALYGDTGEDDVWYNWKITDPQNNSFPYDAPNINFTPVIDGTYNVTLTVGNYHCTSTTNVNVIVYPRSPAPLLELVGNPCADNPPVCLKSSDGIDLYWSNGYYGQTACFYTEGFVTAYYIDKNGCPSEYAEHLICPKPNFDALLTGCYEKCVGEKLQLPVYNFMPRFGNHYCPPSTYEWFYNGHSIQYGDFNNTIEYLLVYPPGEHYMTVSYGDNCVVTSPPLTINAQEKTCCKKEKRVIDVSCYIKGEILFYDITVEICNRGNTGLYLDELLVNSEYIIRSWSPQPVALPPNQCETLHITVEANSFNPSSALFTLIDKENGCDVDFSIRLDPKKCMCGLDIKEIDKKCYVDDEKLFYDIIVEVCNTGNAPLHLDNLLVNDGYSIQDWAPRPVILAPGECKIVQIFIEVKDFTQTSAHFYLFDDKNNCFTPFSVKLDPTNCMCDNEITILNTGCRKQENKLFYDIRVEICNTGTDQLDLFNLMVNSGYHIVHWSLQPLSLRPGECAELDITLEVNDLSQTSAFFTMFNKEGRCFTSFSVPIDPKKCICGSEVEIFNVNCFQSGCRLFYDISVEICNTGTTSLNLEDLIVNSGYTINHWDPQPLLYLPSGDCSHLNIVIEVNDFTQTSAFFTLFDRERQCYVEFLVKLPDRKKCIGECEEIKIDYKFVEELNNSLYFDFNIWLPSGTTNLLSLWVEPPRILNYNYHPPQFVDGAFLFDRHYLEQMAAKDEKVCIYAVVCIDGHHLCLTEICIPVRELLKSIRGTSPMPAPSNMLPEKENENTIAYSISIYPNPAKDELFIVNNGELIINNLEITDLAGKKIVRFDYAKQPYDYTQQPQRKIDVSLLPQGMYLVKIYTENGITVKKFIKR